MVEGNDERESFLCVQKAELICNKVKEARMNKGKRQRMRAFFFLHLFLLFHASLHLVHLPMKRKW